mmetsp:Transcript_2246/g.6113  ORF Transcript_2246/g.6113 Transcript_2246/m.6113 type:complete len:113 (+) Transcript_2246:1030-1368(+)
MRASGTLRSRLARQCSSSPSCSGSTSPSTPTLSRRWTRTWATIVHPEKSNMDPKHLPPLYIRYIRFTSMRDMGAPFVVSEVDVDHDPELDLEDEDSVADMADEAQWVDDEQA